MDDSNSCLISFDHMRELERIYNDLGEKSFDQDLCKELATRFRSESKFPFITMASWEQLQRWFQKKHRESKDGLNLTVVHMMDLERLYNVLGEESLDHDFCKKIAANIRSKSKAPTKLQYQGNRCRSGSKINIQSQRIVVLHHLMGFKHSDLDGLVFEARSKKDCAWHDVGMFLNYRFLNNNKRVKVLVRYHGYGVENDEWVDVDEGVREGSIPLEASDCHKVKERHLVLCYLAQADYDNDYALYCDARVTKIQRRTHDKKDCSCIFTVRFCHDMSEKEVRWDNLRCRPTQEESDPDEFDPTLNPIENLWG